MKYLTALIAIMFLLFYAITPISTNAQPNFSCADVLEIPSTECEALRALYLSTNGENWINKTNWLVTITPSDWYGIIISEGHVSEISLQSNQLSGNIPPELGDLSELKELNLMLNQLTGSIPPELGKLSKLKNLVLIANQLTGYMPIELANLSSLSNLFLQDNQLTGPIPSEIGNMNNLWQLGLSGNQLTGSIPPELGNLPIVTVIQLGDNQLTGEIPPELGNLNNDFIFGLHLYNNQLTGTIPSQLGNLTNLHRLDLSNNQLDGDVPESFINLINLIDPGEDYDGSDGLNLEYNFLNIPFNYPDPTCPLDTFLSQKDLDWHLLQGFNQRIGEEGGTIQSLDSKVLITIPPSSLNEELIFTYTPQSDPSHSGTTLDFAGVSFQLDAKNDLGVPLTVFNSPVTVTIHYLEEDITYMLESSLLIYVWDSISSTWVDASLTCNPNSIYIRNIEENTISTNICHLSEFAVFDQAEKIFLPLILH